MFANGRSGKSWMGNFIVKIIHPNPLLSSLSASLRIACLLCHVCLVISLLSLRFWFCHSSTRVAIHRLDTIDTRGLSVPRRACLPPLSLFSSPSIPANRSPASAAAIDFSALRWVRPCLILSRLKTTHLTSWLHFLGDQHSLRPFLFQFDRLSLSRCRLLFPYFCASLCACASVCESCSRAPDLSPRWHVLFG